MLVEDAAKSGANARNRVLWLVVTALLYAALTWPVILSGITGPGGQLPLPGPGPTFTPDLRPTDDRLILNATLRL